MTRLLIGMVLLAATAAPAMAQSGGQTPQAADVLAAQRQWFAAYAGCNLPALGKIVADDMMFMHHMGRMENKAEFMKGSASCGLTELGSENTKVRLFGDTAVISGDLKWKGKNAQAKGSFMSPTSSASFSKFLYSEVWVKQAGRWVMASHQSTGVPVSE